MLSPAQIRKAAAVAFRNRQRLDRTARRAFDRPSAFRGAPAAARISPAGPAPLRQPRPGETALSPLEISQGIRDGLIDGESLQ